MSGPQPKRYGLIDPKKSGASSTPALPVTAFAKASRLAAFASDSDDDDNSPSSGPVSGAIKPKVNLSLGVLQQRQIKKAQESALADDPTIYQYDELYDDIQTKRDNAKAAQREALKQNDKRPKYIERLLVTAGARKMEHERRIERQVQKERDAEGEEFADKESFVTASYRAKLEEMRAAEAAEQRADYLETIGDVTKQRDLGGFYRHLYEQKMTAGDTSALSAEPIKKPGAGTAAGKREYRKRNTSGANGPADAAESDDEQTGESAVKRADHLQSNLDADSDFSIDSSSEEENQDDNAKPKADQPTKELSEPDSTALNDKLVKPLDPPAEAAEIVAAKSPSPEPEPKVKVNIWLKRTVGDVLEAAIERYQERKRTRCG